MKKISIILISILFAFIIMSSGYGIWQKNLIIEGDLEVVADPEIISSLKAELNELESDLKEKEAQKLLDEQKKSEEVIQDINEATKPDATETEVTSNEQDNNEAIKLDTTPVDDTTDEKEGLVNPVD